jgi:hypothetical protein
MKIGIVSAIVAMFLLAGSWTLRADEKAANKYIGVKTCAPCHRTEKQGSQFTIWQKSAHSGAMKTLATEKAAKIAKEKGLKTAASESPECLSCHTLGTTVDAKLFDKGFVLDDGVQCETCHGAGSGYKTMAIMKDKEKAVAAGLHLYKDDAAIEKLCVTCHNEKSPTYKPFKFKEQWEKIKHPVPTGKS